MPETNVQAVTNPACADQFRESYTTTIQLVLYLFLFFHQSRAVIPLSYPLRFLTWVTHTRARARTHTRVHVLPLSRIALARVPCRYLGDRSVDLMW